MKKTKIFTFLAFTTAVVGGLFCATNLLNTQTNNETNVVAIEKTPKQILADEFAMKKQRRQNGYHKANKPDEYAKYHQLIQTAIDEEKPSYKFGYRMEEYNKAISKLAATRTEANDSIKWTERGPANVPGRTRALIIDPADATRNTWIVGSAGGGIWRTINGGLTFKNLTPNLPNLATNALAMAASNQNVIYAGTGEGYGNLGAVMGNGIFKSIDRGETWQLLSATAKDINFSFVTRIVVSPTDEKLVVASTATGIMRSADGGLSWTMVFDADNRCEQVIATANNFNILYATINGGEIIKSTDIGLTWNLSNDGIVSAKRIELAISPSNPNKLYASIEVSSTESAVYVSENAALTWTQLDDGAKTHYLAGQGWYDNAISVMPTNENIVFVGGVNNWRIDTQNTTSAATTPAFLGVSELNTKSFLSFVNVTNFVLWGGKLQLLNTSLATSVELRFGAGKKQKAHRFLVPSGSTSGVPAANYSYQDYVDVPFEAWDIAKNQQLMVSFRDQRRDGNFELELRNDTDIPREYVYIHAIPYDATTPNTSIAKDGGHESQTIYSVWPLLSVGGTWNPTNLPNSTLKINYGLQNFRKASTTNITDVYNEFSKQNGIDDVHADQHSIHFTQLPNSTRVIITNDGGISVSDNAGATFSKRASGYNTMQCYGVDKSKGFNQYVSGAQDNGCWFSPAGTMPSAETRYTKATGGDGFEVLWHSKQQGKLITSAQYNGFYSSTSGGVSFRSATSGLSDTGEENAPFISRLGSSPLNPDVVFAVGKKGVWKSIDFAGSWKSISMPDNFFFRLSSATEAPSLRPLLVRVSDANPQIVWAGGGMTNFSRLCVSTNTGDFFEPTENYRVAGANFPMGGISGFATHPREQHTAFAIFSLAGRPKILRTKDLGKTWQDLTGFATVGSKSSNGFPDVSVYSVFVFPRNLNKIWAGTEIGIYESLDAGLTWKFYDNFPAVSVWQMKMVDNQIVVATHGRGIWTGEVPDSQVLGLFNDNIVTKPLAFYPNPAKTTITLQLALDLQKYKLSIYNSLGQVVKTENIEAAYQQNIDVTNLPKGIYVLHLQSNKEHFSSKLVVE